MIHVYRDIPLLHVKVHLEEHSPMALCTCVRVLPIPLERVPVSVPRIFLSNKLDIL